MTDEGVTVNDVKVAKERLQLDIGRLISDFAEKYRVRVTSGVIDGRTLDNENNSRVIANFRVTVEV